jgi:predicted permease
MRRLRAFLIRFGGLVRKEHDFTEEIESNLQLHIADNLRAGMTPEHARREALLKLGGVERTKEEYRDRRTIPVLETLVQDLRYGLRMLRRSPAFTATAVLSLALGIGANTAIFSVIDALMLRTLPVQNPEQLVMFFVVEPGFSSDVQSADSRRFQKYRDLRQVFVAISGICLIDRFNVVVNGEGGGVDAGLTRVALVSGNYFSMLGVDSQIGRALTSDDDRIPGGHPVVVISNAYWQRRFASSPDALGRTLMLNGTTYTIIGVSPRTFTGEWVGRPADLWIPMMMQAQVMPERPTLLSGGGGWLRIVARLKRGVTISQAQAAAQVAYQQNLREIWPHPTPQQTRFMTEARLELKPAARGYSPQRDTYGQSLAILMILAGAVLLIACANVANLLLARSSARQREMAVRLAIGAGRARIVRQLLAESVLLAAMGGAVGLLLSVWATKALGAAVGTGPVQLDSRLPSPWASFDLHLDLPILAFNAGLCLLTGILFGLAPAFRLSKTSLSPALGGRGAVAGRYGLGKFLVVFQISLSLLLLIGAGLFVRTLQNLRTQDLGIDRQHLLLAWAAPGQTGRQGTALGNMVRTVQQRISSLPGVLSASVSSIGLLTGGDGGGYSDMLKIPGHAPKPGMFGVQAVVAPGFFATAGMPLLAGHDFREQDTEGKAPQVAIVNETFARFFFGNENPIGNRFGMQKDVGYPLEIVAVVRDGKHGTPREKRAVWYVPYRKNTGLASMCIVIRTARNPLGIVSSIRNELREIDPNLPVFRIDTVEEQLNTVLVQERMIATLAGFFGILAGLLACLGLYGVMSYTAARRTNEIGIRMALGATRFDTLGMVLQESLLIVVVGIAIGVPAALAAMRLISARLFGVSTADPLTVVGAVLLMTLAGILAGLLPARTASKVDPMVALRHE